jgi:hypothetical protein
MPVVAANMAAASPITLEKSIEGRLGSERIWPHILAPKGT